MDTNMTNLTKSQTEMVETLCKIPGAVVRVNREETARWHVAAAGERVSEGERVIERGPWADVTIHASWASGEKKRCDCCGSMRWPFQHRIELKWERGRLRKASVRFGERHPLHGRGWFLRRNPSLEGVKSLVQLYLLHLAAEGSEGSEESGAEPEG